MTTLIPTAFTSPAPLPTLSTSGMRGDTVPCLNRTKRFGRFRQRATVAANARMTTTLDTSRETIRFEDLFPDPSTAIVVTSENEPVSLIEHVQARNAAGEIVLLGWLRHFGCTLCKKQATDWISVKPRLEECGNVSMTLIGNGIPRYIDDFMKEMNWSGYIFTDPERKTYKALQFRAGVFGTFNLPSVMKVVTSFREGNKQTWSRWPTDAFQQGGALVVDRSGVVRLFHADAFAGDHFEKDELVKQICAVAK